MKYCDKNIEISGIFRIANMPGILPKDFSDGQKVCQGGMLHTVCLNSDKNRQTPDCTHQIAHTLARKNPF